MSARPACANGRAGRIAGSVERTVYKGAGEQRGWEIGNIMDRKRFAANVVMTIKGGGTSNRQRVAVSVERIGKSEKLKTESAKP